MGSFEPAGLCWAGLLCLVLAVLKLTGEAHWSWWRVLLPFWVVLGHNILYVAIGFMWLSFSDDGTAEEAVTVRHGHGGYCYQIAALVSFVVFADSVLRHMEGQQETMFLWVSSGRWETMVVFGMLSVIMQLLFWYKIMDPGNRRTRGW
jgi:hypothetical protein